MVTEPMKPLMYISAGQSLNEPSLVVKRTFHITALDVVVFTNSCSAYNLPVPSRILLIPNSYRPVKFLPTSICLNIVIPHILSVLFAVLSTEEQGTENVEKTEGKSSSVSSHRLYCVEARLSHCFWNALYE